jgi:beta-N-acetylhexosaminidase
MTRTQQDVGPALQLDRLCHAVLLPILTESELTTSVEFALRSGARGVLLGVDRHEYLARSPSPLRQSSETIEVVRALTAQVRSLAGPRALVAIDHEPGGLQRFPHLTPVIPASADLRHATHAELLVSFMDSAAALLGLGVNLVLSPVLDVADSGTWLEGRTMGHEPAEVTRVAGAYLQAMSAVGMRTTAKHFPGHRTVGTDPAVGVAVVNASRQELEADLIPFTEAVEAGVPVVMLGPAAFTQLEAGKSASRSAAVVGLLRHELAFEGVALTVDLDAVSVSRSDDIGSVAVDALRAGADWMLVPDGPTLEHCAAAIASAVERGELRHTRLLEAVARLDRLMLGLPQPGRASQRS